MASSKTVLAKEAIVRTTRPGSSRGSFLPPITSSKDGDVAENTEDGKYRAVFGPAEDKVNCLMKSLSTEVMETEGRIQELLRSTWFNVQQLHSADKEIFESELSEVRFELQRTRQELADVTRRENALVKQQSSMSVEKVAEGRARKLAESEAEKLKLLVTSLEQQLRLSKNEGEILKKDQNVALQSVQKQFSDSEQRVKELKEKMSKLNGKSKCMSEELESEKNAYIKLKKELVDLEKQKTAESRKAALELSKLKAQLSASNQSLSAAQTELDKLNSQLKSQKDHNETALAGANKQHNSALKAMQDKVASLEQDIESLHEHYGGKIAVLQQQIAMLKASRKQDDDGGDPRMVFLVHQNRKEKSKLEKQRSKIAT
jgi:chromosome segregation ATPase